MKNVLKIALLCLTLVTLVALVACGGETTTAETTTTAPTVTTEAGDPTLADVIVDGKTEYVIVYDDSNDSLMTQVQTFVSKIKTKTGVEIPYKAISKVAEPYAKEIIIGDLGDKRPVVNEVKKNCKTSDFAISVQNGDLVLYATDDINYKYMFLALIQEEGLVPVNKELTFKSEDDYYYHESELKDMNYLQYKCKDSNKMNTAVVKSLFTYHETTKANGQKLVYRLYVPSNYDPEKEYPLVVVLHGAGERGTDNEAQFGNYILDLFRHKTSPIHDAIVLAPQCPTNNQWVDTPWANGNYSTATVKESDELQTVMKVLEGLRTTYSVDDDRIYATGLSMGGFGTWDLLMRHSDVFAAGMPICGGGDVSKAAELAKIPIRTFHSSNDGIVPSSGTRAMAEAIGANNPVDFAYTEFDSSDHGCWATVGQDLANIEWLFAQSKAE